MPSPALERLIAELERAPLASQLFLAQAMEALDTEGAAGSLTIHIPRRANTPVQVDWHGRNDHPDFRRNA
jgi:hypothetical protein